MSDLRPSIEATQDAITGAQPTLSNDDRLQPPAPVTDPQPPVLITDQEVLITDQEVLITDQEVLITEQEVLITEQEVMFGTAGAVQPRSTPITRRMIGALRVVVTALQLPPPRPHYSHGAAYIERSRMAREMDRL